MTPFTEAYKALEKEAESAFADSIGAAIAASAPITKRAASLNSAFMGFLQRMKETWK